MGDVEVGERAQAGRTARRDRWSKRPVAAAGVSALVLVAPFLAGWLAASGFEWWVPRPAGAARWMWLLATIGVATVAAVGTRPVVRRALPLAALLQVSLVFPDRAPSRVLTALRSGSVRSLERMLTDPTPPPDATTAAVRALSLVGALGRHDRLTRGHCERVRAYADLMARELDLSSDDAERLRWVALLHDIGKIHVPAAVLNKRGKLDEDEWDAIRQHPTDGARLIAGLEDWLGPWAPSIEQHHERFDGGGYPAGLSGEDICLGARVIAVVDAFDVMTASRSYKRPISSTEARRELERCAGAQFDPAVVRSFVALSDAGTGWIAGVLAGLSRVVKVGGGGRVQGSAAPGGATIPGVTAGALARTAAAVGAMALAVAGAPLTAAAAPSPASAPALTATATTPAVTAPAPPTTTAAPVGSTAPSSGSTSTLPTPASTPDPTNAPGGSSGSTTPDPGAGQGLLPPSASIALPPVTVPSVAVPSVTILGITVPSVTLPGVVVPGVSVPPVTVPPAVGSLLQPHH